MLLRKSVLFCLMASTILAGQAFGWGPDGHHVVGAIADKLIEGSSAEKHVDEILNKDSKQKIGLKDASVWADCAKGIDPKHNYEYRPNVATEECKPFESRRELIQMSNFVRWNDTTCDDWSPGNSCHALFHYTDIAIQRDEYTRTFKGKPLTGARNDDIVHALEAAIKVLQGEAPDKPFFQDKRDNNRRREALLMVAHYVGDIHQPLHVGAVYLDPHGNPVDPDMAAWNGQMETQGGNLISVNTNEKNLHATWDSIPEWMKFCRLKSRLIREARHVAPMPKELAPADWPRALATDTLKEAREAFQGLSFGKKENGFWPATLSAAYIDKMNGIKERQLVKAGARLAQLLERIWPEAGD